MMNSVCRHLIQAMVCQTERSQTWVICVSCCAVVSQLDSLCTRWYNVSITVRVEARMVYHQPFELALGRPGAFSFTR